MARISGRVLGRVQGVGFRAFVQRTAQSHGIEGEVWNTHDGAVEFDATTDDAAALEAFLLELRSGPGHVRDLDIARFPGGSTYPGFRIGYTR